MEASGAAKSIVGIIRGCGKRVPGGLYVCSGLAPYGTPIEHFIIDPPIAYDTEPFRAPLIFEKEGKNHVMLWVGAEHYPWPSDMVEEIRNFGVSKRIPNNFDLSKLEPGSMLFLVHPKAIVKEHELLPLPEYCPKIKTEHLEESKECCLGHSYNIAPPNSGLNQRKLGDTVYTVFPQGMTEVEYDYQPGVFMGVPITHFDHVMDGGKVNPAIGESAAGSKLPVNFEEL
ncbi:MAG: hypothetical protein ACHQ0Y_05025 [Thermodesulfovibrionales bacterium]